MMVTQAENVLLLLETCILTKHFLCLICLGFLSLTFMVELLQMEKKCGMLQIPYMFKEANNCIVQGRKFSYYILRPQFHHMNFRDLIFVCISFFISLTFHLVGQSITLDPVVCKRLIVSAFLCSVLYLDI